MDIEDMSTDQQRNTKFELLKELKAELRKLNDEKAELTRALTRAKERAAMIQVVVPGVNEGIPQMYNMVHNIVVNKYLEELCLAEQIHNEKLEPIKNKIKVYEYSITKLESKTSFRSNK